MRAEDASSKLEELADGLFNFVIDDQRYASSKKSKRVIFCSGKVYWDLERFRLENKVGKDVSIVRIEQLYPFPQEQISAILQTATAAKDTVWLQEEPKNCGAFSYVEPLFRQLGVNARYIGRAASASPATGSPKAHRRQQQTIMETAFASVRAKENNMEVR